MENKERKTGRGSGAIRIGAVTVQGRWWFSYNGETPTDDFKLTVALTLADRKKLVNLKKGDWTSVTADPFSDLHLYLSEVEYTGGNNSVSATFRMAPGSMKDEG
jgi:hypothetical protein